MNMWSSSSVSSGSMSSENLPPRTLARVSREVRDMMKNVPEGTKLIVDSETGLPQNLGEIMVSKQHSILLLSYSFVLFGEDSL